MVKVVGSVCAILFLSGCFNEPEEYRKPPFLDKEYGVRIEVMLAAGGTAILVCPRFSSKPAGSHGRECYLEKYDYRILD